MVLIINTSVVVPFIKNHQSKTKQKDIATSRNEKK